MSNLRSTGRAFAAIALAIPHLLAAAAAAQQGLRPGDERPALPEPTRPGAEEPPLALPPVTPPAEDAPLASGVQVRVERFAFSGHTVFGTAALEAAVAPYTGRTISSEELLAARNAVTRLYVDAGYLTSGAVVPDQSVRDGVVRIEVVEAGLGAVEVVGNEHFRDGYFRTRLLRAGRAPLNVERMEAALRLLQRDPLIERVDAVLEPGPGRGESRLRLTVAERLPLALGLEVGNGRSPAVGSLNGVGEVAYSNLVGWGESISARGEISEGVRDVELRVATPLGPWDTRLSGWGRFTQVEIVEDPFDDLDIESKAWTWGVELAQPLWRDERDEVWAQLRGELRELETEVLGEEFCFEPDPGLGQTLSDCDQPKATVLRGGLSWTRRTERNVWAFQTLVSVGVDALGATTTSDRDLADGEFVAWLAQLQWAHVLPESLLGSHLVLRGDVQLASEPLLSFERFAIGGRTSVRGYRENQLVSDSGAIGSAELRVPVWRDALGRHRLELVPFTDVGHGWNEAGPEPEDDLLWSVGVGLRAQPVPGLFAEAWWGGRLVSVDRPEDRAFQDHGVHLRLRAYLP